MYGNMQPELAACNLDFYAIWHKKRTARGSPYIENCELGRFLGRFTRIPDLFNLIFLTQLI